MPNYRAYRPVSQDIQEWFNLRDLVGRLVLIRTCRDKSDAGMYGPESVVVFSPAEMRYTAKGEPIFDVDETATYGFSYRQASPIIRQIKDSFRADSDPYVAVIALQPSTNGRQYFTLLDPSTLSADDENSSSDYSF